MEYQEILQKIEIDYRKFQDIIIEIYPVFLIKCTLWLTLIDLQMFWPMFLCQKSLERDIKVHIIVFYDPLKSMTSFYEIHFHYNFQKLFGSEMDFF